MSFCRTTRRGAALAGLFLLSLHLLSPQEAAAEGRDLLRQRKSWYIGFGLGSGSGDYELNGQKASFSDLSSGGLTLAFNARIGLTLSEKFQLGLEESMFMALGTDVAVRIAPLFVSGTFFPWHTGFFVRAGAGPVLRTHEVHKKALPEEGVTLEPRSETDLGVGAMVGAGYALWLGRQFNLTFNLGYNSVVLDSDRVSYVNSYVGIEWH